MGLKGQTTGGGRGLMSNMILIGLGFLFILIQTTTAQVTKLQKGERKTLKDLFPTPAHMCPHYGSAGDPVENHPRIFLTAIDGREMADQTALAKIGKDCCTGGAPSGSADCKYDVEAAALKLDHKDNPNKMEEGPDKTLQELYSTPVLFCQHYGGGNDASKHVEEFENLHDGKTAQKEDLKKIGEGCCSGAKAIDPLPTTCTYAAEAGKVTFGYVAPGSGGGGTGGTGGGTGDKGGTGEAGADGAGGGGGGGVAIGFSEKLILLTLMVAKLSL